MEYTSFPPLYSDEDEDSGPLLTPISIPVASAIETTNQSAENVSLNQPTAEKLDGCASSLWRPFQDEEDDQARLVISSISFTSIFGDQPKSASSQSEPIDIVAPILPETVASLVPSSRIASTTSIIRPPPSSVSSLWRPFQDEEEVKLVISSI